jgi:hypothetical protein
MSSAYTSHTAVASAINLQKNGQTVAQLLDTGGLCDRGRPYTFVTIISYMLYKIFGKVKYTKFVLTIENSAFIAPTAESLISQIKSFCDIFQFSDLKDEAKRMILNSTYLLITMTD